MDMMAVHINSLLKAKLIALLDEEFSPPPLREKPEKIIENIEKLYETEKDPEFYRKLLYLLVHLEFEEEEAKKHWEGIKKKLKELKEKLNRDISLRVAVLDYFTNEYKKLENPVIVEIFLYEIAEKRAYIDDLTGLYNYRYFKEALWREYKRSKRYNLRFSIVFMDIDNLKYINDYYGHVTGDEVLKFVGNVLKYNKRAEDIACRYGGDEFVIILPETPIEGAKTFVERIRKIIKKEKLAEDIQISISFGIGEFPTDSQDPVELLDLVDKAMYKAKFLGKDRVELVSSLKEQSQQG